MSLLPQQNAVESFLHLAHKNLWHAANVAENWPSTGYADDVYQLLLEVDRLMLDLAQNRRSPRAHVC